MAPETAGQLGGERLRLDEEAGERASLGKSG
jgi:hypothetical protein